MIQIIYLKFNNLLTISGGTEPNTSSKTIGRPRAETLDKNELTWDLPQDLIRISVMERLKNIFSCCHRESTQVISPHERISVI